jgi:Tetratricopeptide repeat
MHPRVAGVASNLASLLADQGKVTQAEPYARRLSEIEEQLHGTDHVETSNALELLAALLVSHTCCRKGLF